MNSSSTNPNLSGMKTRSVRKIGRDRVELDSAEMQQAPRSPCRSSRLYSPKTQVCSIRHNERATTWEKHGKDGWKTVKRERLENKEISTRSNWCELKDRKNDTGKVSAMKIHTTNSFVRFFRNILQRITQCRRTIQISHTIVLSPSKSTVLHCYTLQL